MYTKATTYKFWTGELFIIIHEFHDLATIGQHGLQIKVLNKGNTYLSSMRSISYTSCIKKNTRVHLIISIMLQGSPCAITHNCVRSVN